TGGGGDKAFAGRDRGRGGGEGAVAGTLRGGLPRAGASLAAPPRVQTASARATTNDAAAGTRARTGASGPSAHRALPHGERGRGSRVRPRLRGGARGRARAAPGPGRGGGRREVGVGVALGEREGAVRP